MIFSWSRFSCPFTRSRSDWKKGKSAYEIVVLVNVQQLLCGEAFFVFVLSSESVETEWCRCCVFSAPRIWGSLPGAIYKCIPGTWYVFMCVLSFTFVNSRSFLPVVIQHNQCPCRFFNPKIDTRASSAVTKLLHHVEILFFSCTPVQRCCSVSRTM